MENTTFVLDTNNIIKSYGNNNALKKTNLQFSNEKIYGLFGRNGAGKTTLLDIIASRIYADHGHVNYFGNDSIKQPGVIADNCCYMQEKQYFPARFKIYKLLELGKIAYPNYNEDYAKSLCKLFNLNSEQRYEELSRGHQSIFRIVLGLAAQAPITIFDEPVLGLDAVARDKFYSELIKDFSRNPRLFIISTHFIEESADLFNEAIIINNGAVLKHGAIDEMLSQVFYVSGKSEQIELFIKSRTVLSSQTTNGIKTAVVEGSLSSETNMPGLSFSTLSMQKLFIHLTDGSNNKENV